MTRRTVRLVLSALALAALSAAPVHAGGKNCPPGLAKKAVPCVPPGQAKKGVRYPDRGDYVTHYHYHRIRYPDRYELPPLRPGERYYIVDNRIYRVDEATYEILDFIRATSALLD
ncbi:excinuclease ABC subunit A [Defluviimonas sp. WL0024]|uniref:Excinuclease ABC subunit A n=2 Tax=Albidovulum TaxID=205889 RepID=A0ABT3IZC7_9RHOB|nr:MULTISPECIES: excinuclease ABC subunit A [Defluviimonas]MCU9849710.1 excinuclease ABC subunit A [Defluviimonas sp. WL0024]MCW3780797.1 excinuclease ABC subunit A [Defluviimonas salinarum]